MMNSENNPHEIPDFLPSDLDAVYGKAVEEESYRPPCPPMANSANEQPSRFPRGKSVKPQRWFSSPSASSMDLISALRSLNLPVTYSLIGCCIVLWGVQLLLPFIRSFLIFSPSTFLYAPWTMILAPLSPLPYSFLGGVINLLCIFLMGKSVEPLFSSRLFAQALICIVLFASGGFFLLSPSWYAAMMGTSGLVFGLFGMFFCMAWKNDPHNLQGFVALFIIQLLLVLLAPTIEWRSQLGAFCGGFAATFVIISNRSKRDAIRRITYQHILLVIALFVAIAIKMLLV